MNMTAAQSSSSMPGRWSPRRVRSGKPESEPSRSRPCSHRSTQRWKNAHHQIVRSVCPAVSVTLSHRLGRIGLLPRENVTILNASLVGLARRTMAAFRQGLRRVAIDAPVYLTQNDGTIARMERAMDSSDPERGFRAYQQHARRGVSLEHAGRARHRRRRDDDRHRLSPSRPSASSQPRGRDWRRAHAVSDAGPVIAAAGGRVEGHAVAADRWSRERGLPADGACPRVRWRRHHGHRCRGCCRSIVPGRSEPRRRFFRPAWSARQ